MTSIFQEIEDDPNFSGNGIRPQLQEMEDKLNFSETKDKLIFWKLEDDLIINILANGR